MRPMTIASIIVVVVVILGAGYLFTIYYAPGNPSNSGTIRLLMTDPPHYSNNITSINITFTEIALNQVNSTGNDAWIVLTNSTTTIDLLQIVNVTQSLGSFSVPVGNYSQIRFMVSNATALINNQTVILTIPSGAETGLKVHFQTPLQITANGIVTITIDITADNDGIHNGKLIPSMSATIS
jgi:hypothetical protein